MTTLQIVMGIVQIIFCLILIAIILLQSSKTAGLAGSIGGGAETFFGKNKQNTLDAKLHKFTSVCAIVYVIITCVLVFIGGQGA
ncbi:MAG: preprotein translocase subunit SecG [Clostridia bacterium]|nr:preprotein translocase subunit SecG [Clostridia bacterium]